MDENKEKSKNKEIVKRRILLLLKFFNENTDENHQTDTFELLKYFQGSDTPANRKTLKNDINTLIDAGYDIVVVPSKPNKYFMGDREFETAELKLLVDAVSSSRFITQKKSKQLIEKLTAMASVSHREEMKRNIYPTSRAKSTNESNIYTVDAINDAINRKKKISFKYFEYDVDKKRAFRNGGNKYELSPYALIWNEDFYYVLGYSEKHAGVATYRVDRIREAEVLEEKSKSKPRGFKVEDYAQKTFEMYDGEEAEVKLVCQAGLMKYVIDRFGEGVKTGKIDDDRFLATVNVALSPTFYAWVFQFKGGIKIKSPDVAVKEFKSMAEAFLEE